MARILFPEEMRNRNIPPRHISKLLGKTTKYQIQEINRIGLRFYSGVAAVKTLKTSYRSYSLAHAQQFAVYLDVKQDLNNPYFAKAFAGLDDNEKRPFNRPNPWNLFWFDLRGFPSKEDPQVLQDDTLLVAYLGDYDHASMVRCFRQASDENISTLKFPTNSKIRRAGGRGWEPYEITRLYTYNVSAMQRRFFKALAELDENEGPES